MFSPGVLTFQEFMTHETLPLATIQEAIFEFLRGRSDAVVFDAQAVNAYVNEPRMTQDVDLLSTRAQGLAEELREHLSGKFHVAVRIREIHEGQGYRLYQVRKEGNRHLADVRPVDMLPTTERISEVLVIAPPDLIAGKIIAYAQRRGQPKAYTDLRDITLMLLTFPELKRDPGPVTQRLKQGGADANALGAWSELVAQEIKPTDEEDEF